MKPGGDLAVRPARLDDAGAIAEIYNEGIRDRVATFETRERTAADIAPWIERRRHVLLVADRCGVVIGWVGSSDYRARECYAGIAEFSIYVSAKERGRRVGNALMREFLPACAQAGFWKVLSRIFPENEASLALCRRHGFREVGVYARHAQLDGVWRDVIIVERQLPSVRPATVADLPAVERLLSAAHLPLAGVAHAIATFVVAECQGDVVGVAGLELCRDHGLLRSVAVAPEWQKRGLARELVCRVIAEAEERRLHALYLLTTTAAHYFPRFGFTETPRSAVPADIAATEEFREACPASAIVMVRPTR